MKRLNSNNDASPETEVRYNEHDEPIVLSKALLDILLKEEDASNLIALYCFYYYTAKWQKTNQPKATIQFVANGLKWGCTKVRMHKQTLKNLGLISDVSTRNEKNQITGHYVHVHFIWTKNKVDASVHPIENREGGKSHATFFPQGGSSHSMEKALPNALSANSKNALSANSKNASNSNKVDDLRAREEIKIPLIETKKDDQLSKKKKKSTKFIPPSIEIIKRYCTQRNNKIDPEQFYDFYQSKGWYVGKNKMKDWQACVRTWEKTERAHYPVKKVTRVSNSSGTRINTDNKMKYINYDKEL